MVAALGFALRVLLNKGQQSLWIHVTTQLETASVQYALH